MTNGRRSRLPGVLALLLALVLPTAGRAQGDPGRAPAPVHAIAMHGEPGYGPGFGHFDYVDPDAPKGGAVTLSAVGGYDTLNPFTVRGVPAAGAAMIYDTLMTASQDEPFTQYPLLAQSLRVPEDRSWVEFALRPEARFHDGRPVTARDVVFSFDVLRRTHPFYGAYYAAVAAVEVLDDHTVRFSFVPGDNRELPLILGQLPVLPAHYWESRDFARTTLEPPLGSGPYRIARVDPGRAITYERVEDYWGRDLPVNAGRHNFASLTYDYYLDPTVALQAFKAGLVDFRVETSAKDWATAYDMPARGRGELILEAIESGMPAGLQGFVFNTRRPIFADRKVRWALAHAFDFEWANRVLFHGAYERTDSYFENSELAADGTPGPAELAFLEPLRDALPEEVFTRDYAPPEVEGEHGVRRNLVEAHRLLEEAGWVLREGRRVHAATGTPFAFEILLEDPNMQRIALPLVANLQRLGIEATIRVVDSSQYVNRVQNFDFDMITMVWGQSLSPGNEQRGYWTCEAAAIPGSRNYAGICDRAVDALVERVIAARTREDLVAATRALDRALLWGHYVIPHFHAGVTRVAYWNRLRHPEPLPPYGIAFDAWWVDPASRRDLAAEAGRGNGLRNENGRKGM